MVSKVKEFFKNKSRVQVEKWKTERKANETDE